MAVIKYKYELIINKESYNKAIPFPYGHTKTARIRVSAGGASIIAELTNDYSDSFEGSYAYNLLKEGIKRAELAHVLKYSKILAINSMTLVIYKGENSIPINDIGKLTDFYSLITENLDLPKHLGEYTTIQDVLKLDKTNDGPRFSSLYSYLYSRQKNNEMERFIYQWIAVNGMYRFVGGSLSDRDGLGVLAKQLGIGERTLSKNNRNKIGPSVSKLLYGINTVITKDSLTKGLHGDLSSEIQRLTTASKQDDFSMTPYGFLVLDFPYYLRCKYFHAGIPVLLFNYTSDLELRTITIINGLLKEFLDENIVKLFDGTLHPVRKETK